MRTMTRLVRVCGWMLAMACGFGVPLRAEAPAGGQVAPKPVVPKQMPAVPGGGLKAHEKAGGHLLARHTGKSEADLIERLEQQRGIRSASSFPDAAVAEVVVGVVIASRQKQIAKWLRGDEERLNKPVGIMVTRRNMTAVPVSSVRLVLERDPEFAPLGWRILTGYPQS